MIITSGSDIKCIYCDYPIMTRPGLVIEYNKDGFFHEACRPHTNAEDVKLHPELLFDPVNAPLHYLQTKISPLEVVEDWKLDFHLGSVIKYIGRHPHKGAPLEDLKKAQWYLARKINLMEEK